MSGDASAAEPPALFLDELFSDHPEVESFIVAELRESSHSANAQQFDEAVRSAFAAIGWGCGVRGCEQDQKPPQLERLRPVALRVEKMRLGLLPPQRLPYFLAPCEAVKRVVDAILGRGKPIPLPSSRADLVRAILRAMKGEDLVESLDAAASGSPSTATAESPVGDVMMAHMAKLPGGLGETKRDGEQMSAAALRRRVHRNGPTSRGLYAELARCLDRATGKFRSLDAARVLEKFAALNRDRRREMEAVYEETKARKSLERKGLTTPLLD